MHQLRMFEQHGLGAGEALGAAPFHHIDRQGPGAARKSDQGHPAGQLAPNHTHRVHDIAQLVLHIGNRQPSHGGGVTNRMFKAGAFPLAEVEPKPHGVRDRQDVGKQNGRVQGEPIQRLQGHLAGQLRIPAQVHKITGTGAGGPVLGQVAPSLTHDPHWRVVHAPT